MSHGAGWALALVSVTLLVFMGLWVRASWKIIDLENKLENEEIRRRTAESRCKRKEDES
jgi:hypothetical protein